MSTPGSTAGTICLLFRRRGDISHKIFDTGPDESGSYVFLFISHEMLSSIAAMIFMCDIFSFLFFSSIFRCALGNEITRFTTWSEKVSQQTIKLRLVRVLEALLNKGIWRRSVRLESQLEWHSNAECPVPTDRRQLLALLLCHSFYYDDFIIRGMQRLHGRQYSMRSWNPRGGRRKDTRRMSNNQ